MEKRTSGSLTSNAARAAVSRPDGNGINPSWSGDGRSIIYSTYDTLRRSGSVMKRVLADGSGRGVEEIGPGGGGVVSRDGHLFYVVVGQQGMQLWYRSLTDGKEKPAPFVSQSFYGITAAPSPDGRLVAYEVRAGRRASRRSSCAGSRPPRAPGRCRRAAALRRAGLPTGTCISRRGRRSTRRRSRPDPDVRVGAPALVFKRTAAVGLAACRPRSTSRPTGSTFSCTSLPAKRRTIA